ncbi:GlxA family transcriptional regulator [Microbaculum sp. FT89]|uniref:GlxA family transcriptional regulator n=1 Tax=Microbaculum sp. FT89 TaxID=3447298 RepID=UPI003F532B4B
MTAREQDGGNDPETDETNGLRPVSVGFLVFPDFSLMAFSSASEPLRAANRLAGKTLYEWRLLSSAGGEVPSSSGFNFPTLSIGEVPAFDRLLVVASLGIETLRDRHVMAFLQRVAREGKPLGAISTGTFVLARAGLLADHRCTLHWESIPQFAEEFPDIQVSREIYVRDRNRWTCAGGIAAIDLTLDQIRTDYGSLLASEVADQFLYHRIRGAESLQRTQIEWRYGINNSRISAAIACMEANIENVVDISEIAQRCNLSLRQMERLWHRHLNMTPQKFYLAIRLKEARKMLRESSEPIAAIALRCGFVSASHMGQAYRRLFDRSPGEERKLMIRS